MLHELNNQLRHILKDIRLQQKLHYRKERAEQALKEAEKSLVEAENKLRKEFEDVKVLREGSVRRRLLNLLGIWEKILAREQKEYETALAHRDELKSQIVQFRHDINQINPQLEKMAPLKGLLKEVLSLKQDYLRTNSHPLQQQFLDIEKDILNSKKNIADFTNVIRWGQKYMYQVNYLNRILNDFLEQGGRISCKQQRIIIFKKMADVYPEFLELYEDILPRVGLSPGNLSAHILKFHEKAEKRLRRFEWFGNDKDLIFVRGHRRMIIKTVKILGKQLEYLQKKHQHLHDQKDKLIREAD